MMVQMGQTQKSNQKHSAQLASGNKLIDSSIDAAGLAIANKIMSQLIGMNQADRNVQDGISMMQTAEGGLSSIGDITHRINELTVQASNDTLTGDQRAMIQTEIDQLTDEISSIAQRTQFNNKNLLDGSLSEENGGAWIQMGANAGQGERVNIQSMTADALGIGPGKISVLGDSGSDISNSIGASQAALNTVTSERAKIGATINRMEHTSSALGTSAINAAAAHSRIADADMAKASMNLIKEQVLEQVSISMMRNLMENEYMLRHGVLQTLGT
jgi:flagellin